MCYKIHLINALFLDGPTQYDLSHKGPFLRQINSNQYSDELREAVCKETFSRSYYRLRFAGRKHHDWLDCEARAILSDRLSEKSLICPDLCSRSAGSAGNQTKVDTYLENNGFPGAKSVVADTWPICNLVLDQNADLVILCKKKVSSQISPAAVFDRDRDFHIDN